MSTSALVSACTNTKYATLVLAPGGGMWVRPSPDGAWWAPPTSHTPPAPGGGRLVVDRWLADACRYTSDLGSDRGHRWIIHQRSPSPPRARARLVCGLHLLEGPQVAASARATADWVAGRIGLAERGCSLEPAWVWWLWILGRLDLGSAQALAVLEYVTQQQDL